MKLKCELCKRMVGVTKGIVDKHRRGRSKPDDVKSVCTCSGMDIKPGLKQVAKPPMVVIDRA